jgi:hypothetical protein
MWVGVDMRAKELGDGGEGLWGWIWSGKAKRKGRRD